MELRLGFLVSKRTGTVRAILKSIKKKKLNAEAKIIISNSADEEILKVARKNKLNFVFLDESGYPLEYKSFDEALALTLIKNGVNFVVLADYFRKIGPVMLDAYKNKIINIHPSLLPRHSGKGMYGLKVHESVLASEEKYSGATIHMVDKEYDTGKILAQMKVPRYPRDTAQSLAERVKGVEADLCIGVLKQIQEGKIKIG